MNWNLAWTMLKRKLLTTWLPVGVIVLAMVLTVQ